MDQRYRYFASELAIVTAGVFVALSVDGCRQWMADRQLVAAARVNLAQEIANNRTELESVLNDLPGRQADLQNAVRLADEVLAKTAPTVTALRVGFNLAELSTASWHTAQATGALAHMSFEDVKRYSELYNLQEIYTAHQRRTLERVASAMAIFGGDPQKAAAKDLEVFRQQVLGMRGDLIVLEQLGGNLKNGYEKTLAR